MEEQGNEDSPRRRGRRRYPKEFRRDAAALVIDQRRTVADVARQLGVVEQTLGNWVRQERIDRGEREGLSSEDRALISELERPAQTIGGLLGEGVGPVSRCHHVDAMKAAGFPVRAACKAAAISASSYYEWKARRPSVATLAENELLGEIREIYTDSDENYGSPRVTRELRSRGRHVNHKRVERLMHLHELVGITERRRVRTTIPAEDAPPLPDLVERRFAPGEPDVAWAGDITYIPTDEGWLYLSSVLDLGSRRLIGWKMDDNMATPLVADALKAAVQLRGGARGVIFHSDRGSQTGLNWSSQHLDNGGDAWVFGNGSELFSCIGDRSPHRGDRQLRGVATGSRSGRRSLAG